MSQLPVRTTAAAESSANINTTSGQSPLSDQFQNCPNLVQSIQTHQTKRLMTPNVAIIKLPAAATHPKIRVAQIPLTFESWQTRWYYNRKLLTLKSTWKSEQKTWPLIPWSTLQKHPRLIYLCPSRTHKSILHHRPSQPVFWTFHPTVSQEVAISTAHGMMTWWSLESTLTILIAIALWVI